MCGWVGGWEESDFHENGFHNFKENHGFSSFFLGYKRLEEKFKNHFILGKGFLWFYGKPWVLSNFQRGLNLKRLVKFMYSISLNFRL